MSRIGIIAALPGEVSMLTRETVTPGKPINCGRLIVCAAGIGAANAQQASRLVHRQGAATLVSWGCAGALDPALKAGDFVLADQVCKLDKIAINTSNDLNNQLREALSTVTTIHTGMLVQSPTIVTSTRRKQDLFDSTSAIAVDMESYSIGDYARQHRLPFVTCRAVADTARTELPKPIIEAMNEQGRIDYRKVLLNTLYQPSAIASLVKLGIHFNKARTTLSGVANTLANTIH